MSKFLLPTLPYNENSLSPVISSATVDLHYGKHHQAYYTMLNNLIENSEYESMSLDEIVIKSFNDKQQKIFNNAGQAWNHNLYWNQMSPNGKTMIQSKLASKIEESFETFDNFVQQFTTASLGVFGSGWTWLVEKDNTLAIMGLPNAENPLTYNQHALMGIDVWEHAYYLDYKNLRGDYVKAILENLINWDFVENRLS